MKFYLGTHMPNWLSSLDVPLFVSRRRLATRKRFPRAICGWALDSGGFSELSLYGGWSIGPNVYADDVRRYRDEIGKLEWAAIQDWMCEPVMLNKTGLTVRRHQELTVQSYLDLMTIAPDLPWVPVLQGWTLRQYIECIDLYASSGVFLTSLPLVGVGSVCRRQGTTEIAEIFGTLNAIGLKCHAFGLKIRGLMRSAGLIRSADSLAWSFAARRDEAMPGCKHKTCANCSRYALAWRNRVVRICERESQSWFCFA